jgi:hypothetical protein
MDHRFTYVEDQPLMNTVETTIIVAVASTILFNGLLIHARIIRLLTGRSKVSYLDT